MSVLRGFDIWVCDECGYSVTVKSGDYGHNNPDQTAPGFNWDEILCYVCEAIDRSHQSHVRGS